MNNKINKLRKKLKRYCGSSQSMSGGCKTVGELKQVEIESQHERETAFLMVDWKAAVSGMNSTVSKGVYPQFGTATFTASPKLTYRKCDAFDQLKLRCELIIIFYYYHILA